MNTLQARGTTTHVLTKNTAGQCQPQGSHDHMTAANATERTKHLTNVNRRPRHYQTPTKNATDQTSSWS